MKIVESPFEAAVDVPWAKRRQLVEPFDKLGGVFGFVVELLGRVQQADGAAQQLIAILRLFLRLGRLWLHWRCRAIFSGVGAAARNQQRGQRSCGEKGPKRCGRCAAICAGMLKAHCDCSTESRIRSRRLSRSAN